MVGGVTDERGQSTVWMIAVLLLAALLAVQLTRTSGEAREQSRLQSVADLAALAGVTGGRNAAEAISQRDGASIAEWSRSDTGRVSLRVRVRGLEAVAAAEPDEAVDDPQ